MCFHLKTDIPTFTLEGLLVAIVIPPIYTGCTKFSSERDFSVSDGKRGTKKFTTTNNPFNVQYCTERLDILNLSFKISHFRVFYLNEDLM